MLRELNIPIIAQGDLQTILEKFENIKSNYPILNELPKIDLTSQKNAIAKRFEMLNQFDQ